MEDNQNICSNPDLLPEIEMYANKYPNAEEALFRMGIDRLLTPEQKQIWEYWNYDRLTQEEIASKTHSEQSLIAKKIKTIEKQLTKWCREHLEIYHLLQEVENNNV